MKIILYQDDTLNLNLDELSAGLADTSGLNVVKGRVKFRVKGDAVQ
jgi:hypothetical protein